MKKLTIILTTIFLTTGIMAKLPGKFLKYSQVTDKEVVLESTKGYKVLFTAYDNNSIGVTYFDKNDNIKLITPSAIESHYELSGSIYVEELDELMQITTTNDNGIMIKIDKKHFGFTFIDKTDYSELVFEEGLATGLFTNKQTFCFIEDMAGN